MPIHHFYRCRVCGAEVRLTSNQHNHPLLGRLAIHNWVLDAGRPAQVSGVRSGPGIVRPVAFHSDTAHGTVNYTAIPPLARDWIDALQNGGALPATVTSNGPHNTDPKSGKPNNDTRITITEYYIGGAAGERGVRRVGGGRTDYFYIQNHFANQYHYKRVLNVAPNAAQLLALEQHGQAAAQACGGTLAYLRTED